MGSHLRGHNWVPMALLLTISMMTLVGASDDRTLAGEDDFTGIDGEPPDPGKWIVHVKGPENSVHLDDGNLLIRGVKDAWPGVEFHTNFTFNELTVLLDWKPVETDRNNNMMSVGVRTRAGDGYVHRSYVAYDTYWGWTTIHTKDDERVFIPSYDTDVEFGEWYTIDLTVHDGLIDVTGRKRSTGEVAYQIRNVTTDDLRSDNKLFIGLDGSVSRFDNLRIYDGGGPPNVPPVFRGVPTPFSAVEDVPLAIDLTSYVHDPDGGPGNLTISSYGPSLVSVEGMVMTLVFHDGIERARIPVIASDGMDEVQGWISVLVEPAVRPPRLNVDMPREGSVFEAGTPVTFIAVLEDPDSLIGEDAKVAWTSDLSRDVMVGIRGDALAFNASHLDVGVHNITVTLTDDGTALRASVGIEIVEDTVGPGEGEGGNGYGPIDLTTREGLLVLVVVVLVFLLTTGWVAHRRG